MGKIEELGKELSGSSYTGNWLKLVIQQTRTCCQDDEDREIDSLNSLLAKVSAFTHMLLMCETDDPELIRRAVIRVRNQFLETIAFNYFPAFRPSLKMVVGRTLQHFTIRDSIPKVWLYHRCCEAVRDLRRETKMGPHDCRLEAAGFPKVEIPVSKFTRAEQCVMKEIARLVRYIPEGECVRCCRAVYLKWVGFSEEEVGFALEESRSSARRLIEECEQRGKQRAGPVRVQPECSGSAPKSRL